MRKDDVITKVVFFLGGIFMVSTGINLLIAAGLGADPWSVFHVGLTHHLPLTLGQVVQGVGITMIFVGWALKVTPTLGTFANMYLFGLCIDFIDKLGVIKLPKNTFQAWIYLIAGIVIYGIGNGVYLNGKLGSGPRDSLLLGLTRATGKSVSIVKTIMEILAVSIGWLLGGKVGIGSLLFAVSIGPVMQWSISTITLPKSKESLLDESTSEV